MNTESLEKKLSEAMGKSGVVKLVNELEKVDFPVKDLIDLTFHKQHEIGFRAAWILENYLLADKQRLINSLDYFLQRLPQVKNPSCRRHFAKILQELTLKLNTKKADQLFRNALIQSNLELVVEACFDWMIDPKAAIAVKAFCMESLFNLSFIHPWILEELRPTIEFLMKDGSAGIASRGKKILNLMQ
jgi:hypothetical protein